MYAQLNENDELVGGVPIEIFRRSRSFKYTVDGVVFTAPSDWFTAWDKAKKEALHLWPMTTNTWDTDRLMQSGDPIDYGFDGATVFEMIPTMANPEPGSLNRYKNNAYAVVDGEESIRIAAAENTPSTGVDYTEDPRGRVRANRKRNNKSKKKNNKISDADDHLFDHIDKLSDASEIIRDDIEAASDYDAVDVIIAAVPTDARWPAWAPIA